MSATDVYICHSKKDVSFVRGLCKALDQQGISYKTSHQGTGEKDPSQNVADIKSCRLVVFIATHNSYRSPFAVKELVYAFNNLPISNIIVYQADDAKLPESIKFTTYSSNIINSDHHLVSNKLIQKICKSLNHQMQPFDEQEIDEQSTTDKTWFYVFVLYVYPVIGLAASACLGWLQQSILFGASVFVAAAALYFYFLFASIEEFLFKTPMGKVVTIFRYVLSLAMIVMIPVSTWQGICSDSWATGLLWLGTSWTILIAMLVLANKAGTSVTLGRAALTNRRNTKNSKDLFLCHDEKDKVIVERIITELRRNGITFITNKEMPVEEAVERSCAFLYIGSANCYANETCNKELLYGFKHRRPILAYTIDQTEMPEEKKMVFSNSNMRSISTYPIETTLMSDLKEILDEARRQSAIRIDSSFWRTLLLITSGIIVLAVAGVSGYMMGSVSLFITILLCLMFVAVIVSDASDKRKRITRHVPKETVALEIALTLSAALFPPLLWLWLSPGPWTVALLIFLLIAGYGFISDFVEKQMRKNPAGGLRPDQVDSYFDVFISYSRRNTDDADEICKMLEREKMSFFIDRQGIPGGSEFPTVLADAISNCGIFLCLLSEDSMASKFCRQEMQYAESRKLDRDIVFVFKGHEFQDSFYKAIESNEKLTQKFKKFPQLCKENDWEQTLTSILKEKIPETKQYKKHKAQTTSRSIFSASWKSILSL